MGVRCLETFLEKSVRSQKVSINELVAKFKSDRGDSIDEVVIVVEGNSCIRQLNDDDWLLGGEIKRFKEKVKRFVDSFKRIGIRLVIYFHEPRTVGLRAAKNEAWLPLQTGKFEYYEELFGHLHREEYPLPPVTRQKKPVWINDVANYLFISLGCEVRTSEQETKALVEYARSHRSCLAILAQDTSYVIFQGAEYYLSFKHLVWDVHPEEEITTMSYDRWALARHVGIPAAQLPLFASLCGNDVIKWDDLQEFHKVVIDTWHMHRRRQGSNLNDHKVPVPVIVFQGVARYIRDRWQRDDTGDLASIASHVFPNDTTARTEQLRQSVESYGPQSLGVLKLAPKTPSPEEPLTQSLENGGTFSIDANWQSILTKAWEYHEQGAVMIHNIVNGYGVKQSITMEDFWSEDLPLTGPLLLPLRQRIYGILLRDKSGGPGTVEEWFINGLPPQMAACREPILPPEELHPGLLTLWGDEANNVRDIADVQWKLFAYTVSPNLNHRRLRSLAEEGTPHLVVPTAILFYLREAILAAEGSPQYLLDWEVEAMAIQAALMKSTSDPSSLIIPTPYDVRAIRLASIFSRAQSQMVTLLVSCGCPIPLAEAMPWLYFDGKLFHKTYLGRKNNQSVESLCIKEDGDSVMEPYLKMRNIVFGPA